MAHVVALRWDLGAAGWSCQAGLAEFLQALLEKLFPLAWVLLGWLAVTAPREEKPLQLQFVIAASGQGSARSFLTPSQRGLGFSKRRISSSILGLLL